MWLTRGTNQAIEAEIGIIGFVAKVAAIGKPFGAIGGETANPLIHPIPDKAPLQPFVLMDCRPIFLKIAGAVTHRVGIFTHDDRAVIVLFGQLDNAGDGGIHGADDVGDGRFLGGMVVEGTGRFLFACPGGHCVVVGAITRFVAQ